MAEKKLTDAEQKAKLDDIAKRMKRPGANMERLNAEIDRVLGMPSEPEPSNDSDWESANHG